MYPEIEIKTNNILENVDKVNKLCENRNIKLSLVVKVLANNYDFVKKLENTNIKYICDSRIQNLKSYEKVNLEKWLIRIPMLSEVDEVVKYSDASLNTELKVIEALNEAAKKQNKIHKIILMYELGDLREGASKEELDEIIEKTKELENINIYGIGTNLSCYGEIIPTEENMKEFSELVTYLENKHNIKFEIVCGGNSSSYNMMKDGKLPKNINNLRLGESVFLGNVPCFEEKIDDLNRNNFVLKTQIIELKEKPSIPWGEIGKSNSFGETTTFIDKGIRKRAIIALGKQDVRIEGLFPVDKNIIILGGSSDHIILDVTDSENNYKIGDIIEFNLNYSAILCLMNSKDYINRKMV